MVSSNYRIDMRRASIFLVLGILFSVSKLSAQFTGGTGDGYATASSSSGWATTLSLTSGDSQTDTVSTALTNPFVVTVTDGGGLPVSDVVVTFAIATTPSSATGQSLSTGATTTNLSGQVSSTLTLGNKVGTYTVTATSGSLGSSLVTFTATATNSTATKYIVSSSSSSPAAGTNVTITAQLADVNNNAVPTSGNIVTWSKSDANGSFATATSTTNGSGVATVVFTTHTVSGTATTVTGTDASSLTGTSGTITTDAPLPIELVSFTAAAKHLNAELRWSTATEVNNYGFEIERRSAGVLPQGGEGAGTKANKSTNATSQQSDNWTKVGFVEGSGTTTDPREYSFVDRNVKPRRYAYRIKQIDNNGSFKYTESVELEVGLAPLEFALAQNYPNPFNPSTTIEFTLPKDGRVVLKVYNMVGEEIVTLLNEEQPAGRFHQIRFDASRLSTGVYFSSLEFDGIRLVKKMVLLK